MTPDDFIAFPTQTMVSQNQSTGETILHQQMSDGMGMRDYFAAHAPEPPHNWRDVGPAWRGVVDIVAWRWFYADAMLAARKPTT